MILTASSESRAQSADDWWGRDKALHFTASAAIAGGGYALGVAVFDAPYARVLLGAGLGVAAGVGKELLDLAGYGDPSWRDLAWDAIGVSVGTLAAWGIDMVVRAQRPTTTQPRRVRWMLAPTLTAGGASLLLVW